jgi:beta-glucosidase
VQALSKKFVWGAATAAYQVEGAAADDGRGPSIWDVYSRTPGKTANGDTGDVACDHYHRWREDLGLMRELNLQAYRFSVSWPRVMPQGRGAVNAAGMDFYDRLVDGLCDAGIAPFVTLYHWDLPAALQMELNGWVHPDLPKLFADYAGLMYDRLGDRVRHWLTLNEPWCVVDGGYFCGGHAPGARNHAWGYRAGHNLMRAHAYAVARYRASRHAGGAISFALNMAYTYPAGPTDADRAAAERAMIGMGGWFGDPPYHGDYPAIMRERLGPLLPEFTAEETALLKRSTDFLALNYYLSEVVRDAPGVGPLDYEKVHHPDHARTAMDWPIVPDGLRGLLHWLRERYPSLPLYITENGACFEDHPDPAGFVDDVERIAYLRDHIGAVQAAVAEGADVRGYFVWSLLDNFEWALGYSKRLGLVFCDYATQRRTVKASGRWYAQWIASAAGDPPPRPPVVAAGKSKTRRASVPRP